MGGAVLRDRLGKGQVEGPRGNSREEAEGRGEESGLNLGALSNKEKLKWEAEGDMDRVEGGEETADNCERDVQGPKTPTGSSKKGPFRGAQGDL